MVQVCVPLSVLVARLEASRLTPAVLSAGNFSAAQKAASQPQSAVQQMGILCGAQMSRSPTRTLRDAGDNYGSGTNSTTVLLAER